MRPGAIVRLTAEFMRNTGQYAGSDAHGQWRVVECTCSLCATGQYVAVNEPNAYPEMYARLPATERPKCRHILVANLEIVHMFSVSFTTDTGPSCSWCQGTKWAYDFSGRNPMAQCMGCRMFEGPLNYRGDGNNAPCEATSAQDACAMHEGFHKVLLDVFRLR